MSSVSNLVLPGEIILTGSEPGRVVIGLLVPMSGIMGVIGPAVVNCARLAAEEASNYGDGRPIDLVLIDAGRQGAEVAREVNALAASGMIDGFVGCHTSDIRAAVSRTLAGRVPYIFTPPREFERRGGSGTYLLGPAPDTQLIKPLHWLHEKRRISRWALIGSDYIWPRHVHRAARSILRALALEVACERIVGFGDVDADTIIRQALRERAEGIIVSLVGRDAVTFHRQFARSPWANVIPRLCTSLDEDCLLAVGGDSTGNLFAAMPSFLTDTDERHQKLLAAYQSRFGVFSPSLGAYSESMYDGMHLMSALQMAGTGDDHVFGRAASRLVHTDVAKWHSAPLGAPRKMMSLALANGTGMDVVARFALA